LYAMYLVISKTRLFANTDMLRPFILGFAQPTNPQDHKFSFARWHGRFEEDMIAKHQPSTHQIGMVRQRFENVGYFPLPCLDLTECFFNFIAPLSFGNWFEPCFT